jgi:phosphatidate cytidylyltransferase
MRESNLFLRVVSSFIFLPFLVVVAWLGGVYYLILIEIGVWLGVREFFNILEKRGLKPYKKLGIIATLLLVWTSYFASHLFTFFVITMLFFIVSTVELSRKSLDRAIYHISATLFGVFYVGWLMSHLILLRQVPVFIFYGDIMSELKNFHFIYFHPYKIFSKEYLTGTMYTLLPFILAWTNDTGAYFAGKKFGKHKMFERISPGKSWEGVGGGAIFCLIGIIVVKIWFAEWLRWIDALMLLILGVGGAVCGDLVESLLKRDAKMKDAGDVIPGHGGFLDRFDSVLFIAPLVYYYLRFVVL